MTIYNGYDPEKRYSKVLVHADRVAQSSEQNELQSIIDNRITRLANVSFSDGDITEGARCTVNPETGACALEAGSIYIAGAVHDLVAAALQVNVVGTVYVGVVYAERVITAVDDPSLYNKANGAAGYGEPGADRVQIVTSWGVQGDGQQGSFYAVWTIEDGIVRPREPAPTNSATTQAIKRYDVDSTGGTYAVRGLKTVQQPDDEQGRQVFTVTAGAARVMGNAVVLPSDRRLVFAAVPDVQQINAEPHNVDTAGLVHVLFDRWPVLQPATVKIQRSRSVKITHGAFVGAADPLPENSVVKITNVKQGATTYNNGADYKLTASQVDWSPGGAEIIPGSEYDCTFEYISTEPVLNQTSRGFDVQGGVPQTVMGVDYAYALRRIDRVVMNADGLLSVVKGISATWSPVAPSLPGDVLALASIYQMWDEDLRRTSANAVRAVPMDVLEGYQEQINGLKLDQAELRLATDVAGRYSGLKKGYFADPMIDSSMRDQGRPQTAMIANGALQLYENHGATMLGDGTSNVSLAFTLVSAITQPSVSRSMPVNGSGAQGVLPASVSLTPAQDRWEVSGELAYPRDINFLSVAGLSASENKARQDANFDTQFDPALLDLSQVFIRELDVTFEISGFAPLEPLKSVAFDGLPVVPTPHAGGTLVANAQGVVSGVFRIPAGLSVGTKVVEFKGEHGNAGNAHFTGGASIKVRVSGFFSSTYGSRGYGQQVVTYVV